MQFGFKDKNYADYYANANKEPNVQEMSEVVNAAIKWWWAQEKSDTEYHNAEHELSATVGRYCVRNKL